MTGVPPRDEAAKEIASRSQGALSGIMRITGFLVLASIAAPAYAMQVAVPEPSTLALFGIGVLGVIIGRHGSRGKRD